MFKRLIHKVLLACFAAMLLLVTPAWSADTSVPSSDIVVPYWDVDMAHSRLSFVAMVQGNAFDGGFTDWGGEIVFSSDHLEHSRLRVAVRLASVRSNDAGRDEMLRESDWLDPSNYTEAVYEAAIFKDLGGGRFAAEGYLELKGMRLPLILPFTLETKGDEALVEGSAVISRTAFGIGWSDVNSVADEVEIRFSIRAARHLQGL